MKIKPIMKNSERFRKVADGMCRNKIGSHWS